MSEQKKTVKDNGYCVCGLCHLPAEEREKAEAEREARLTVDEGKPPNRAFLGKVQMIDVGDLAEYELKMFNAMLSSQGFYSQGHTTDQ